MNKKITLENPYTIIDATCYVDRPNVFDAMEDIASAVKVGQKNPDSHVEMVELTPEDLTLVVVWNGPPETTCDAFSAAVREYMGWEDEQ